MKPPTFYKTVINSKEWIEWEEVASHYGFDWAESTECGWLSPEHFEAFLKFVKGKSLLDEMTKTNQETGQYDTK